MSQAVNTIVNTSSGKLQGQNESGLFVFRGIPYAAPPTGPRRGQPPQPAEPWQGVRSANDFGPIAPQGASASTISAFREPAAPEPQSEDCLFLNVWTPGLDDRRRPVMVWIHGGAFARGSGSSSRQPADTLARRGNVALVTINYRLGPLGFLRLKEATNGLIPATGNEGLLDQIAALEWVKKNIASFGGDPSNVTVFGESAGAMSIGCLLAMPQAKGLFQKAILQSGASTVRPLDSAIKIGERFLAGLGIEAKELMSLNPDVLINAQLAPAAPTPPGAYSFARGATFEPVVDGESLPEIPLDALQKGSAKDVIVLTGSNLEEAKLFGAASPALKDLDEKGLMARVGRQLPIEYGKPLIEQYRAIRKKRGQDTSPAEILMAIQTDQQFRIPDVRLAENQRRLGMKAYNYLFDWKSAAPGLGACHALDVGFVFNCLDANFHGSGAAADRLVDFMQDAWLAFARTGDPSCESLGKWPLYGDERNTMILGENCHVEAAPYEEERRIWDSVPNEHLG